MAKGLSHKIYAPRNDEVFYIKGPMGKGLMLNSDSCGNYIAFAGGTGVLVFLDLVTRIAMNNMGMLPREQQLADDFVFHFYASFHSEDYNIGVNLCRKVL